MTRALATATLGAFALAACASPAQPRSVPDLERRLNSGVTIDLERAPSPSSRVDGDQRRAFGAARFI